MKPTYDNDLIQKVQKWLGKKGISFFLNIKEKYGRIDAIWDEGGIPHAVHFREGMQVRNFLRDHVDWDAHQLDNTWVEIIEEAIK